MKMAYLLKATAALLALATSGYPVRAAAETINCLEITSLPTTISTQGVYCLKKHLATNLATGAAITVLVNNVTIDCNEYKVGNLAAGPATQASGVRADGRLNVTVRNCGIRGFLTGIDLVNGAYRVESNRLDHNMQSGIRVTGSGSVIKDNEIIDTGQTSVAGVNNFYGISSEGDIDIIGNIINGVSASTGGGTPRNAFGIYGSSMNAGLVQGNRVNGLVPYGLLGNRHGIRIAGGFNNTVRGNTIAMGSGLLAGDTAIQCGGSLVGLIGGVAVDNVVLQAGLLGTLGALINCTSILGGNHVSL